MAACCFAGSGDHAADSSGSITSMSRSTRNSSDTAGHWLHHSAGARLGSCQGHARLQPRRHRRPAGKPRRPTGLGEPGRQLCRFRPALAPHHLSRRIFHVRSDQLHINHPALRAALPLFGASAEGSVSQRSTRAGRHVASPLHRWRTGCSARFSFGRRLLACRRRATGDWQGRDGSLACLQAGNCLFAAPRTGLCVFDESSGRIRFYRDGWQVAAPVSEPQGGSVVDSEARSAISQLVAALVSAGILATA